MTVKAWASAKQNPVRKKKGLWKHLHKFYSFFFFPLEMRRARKHILKPL